MCLTTPVFRSNSTCEQTTCTTIKARKRCCLTCFRAGMLSGDVVVEINGVKVNTSEEIYQAVRSSDKITMVVQRGNKLLQLQMTPEYTEWHWEKTVTPEKTIFVITMEIAVIKLQCKTIGVGRRCLSSLYGWWLLTIQWFNVTFVKCKHWRIMNLPASTDFSIYSQVFFLNTINNVFCTSKYFVTF